MDAARVRDSADDDDAADICGAQHRVSRNRHTVRRARTGPGLRRRVSGISTARAMADDTRCVLIRRELRDTCRAFVACTAAIPAGREPGWPNRGAMIRKCPGA